MNLREQLRRRARLFCLALFGLGIALVSPAGARAQGPAGGGGAAQTFASLRVVPPEFGVGEEVEWVLTAEHPRRTELRLVREDPAPDYSWHTISGPTFERQRLPAGRARSLWRWRMMSLEAGERELPQLELRDASGQTIQVEVAARSHYVPSHLAAGEDAPRPPAGLHEPVDRRGAQISPWWLSAPPAAAVGLLALLWLRSRRVRRAAPAPPTPAARLAALRQGQPGSEAEVRELFYALAQILRTAFDQQAGRTRAALTDQEWIARSAPAGVVGEEGEAQLCAIFETCEAVKYGGAAPTRFRVEECLEAAAALLEQLNARRAEEAA